MENRIENVDEVEEELTGEDCEAPERSGSKVAVFVILALLLIASGFAWQLRADITGTVALSPEEQKIAIGLAERRNRLSFQRQEAANAYQSAVNRIQEEESALNVEQSKLWFDIRKAHSLAPNGNFVIDEWRGVLKVQKPN